ncbi:luminal-binding protein 3-like [Coffea arabica]|uniref:Luminal-binding protein 3-like n=1 Tax=Coffea arabica TaxID=13443 RepID=A0A6P6VJX5_COFAR
MDKAAKKSNSITITNEKGRLTAEEIDRMVKEAEEFAGDDKEQREKIDSRNKLESYIYNTKSSIRDDEKLAGKIDSDDKESIETALKDALEWLDDNQNVEKLDYDEKMAGLEAAFNPIIRKANESSAGSSADPEDESNYEL